MTEPQRVRFADLMERHEREIHRFAFRMVGHLDDAQDVLQDTFLAAFRAFGRLSEGANHRAWLYRIALRKALNHRRAAGSRPTVPLEATAEAEAPAPSGATGRREDLDTALGRLSARQRGAVLMRQYEGLSYDEVAKALCCSEETARAHVYQAMKKLRTALGAKERS